MTAYPRRHLQPNQEVATHHPAVLVALLLRALQLQHELANDLLRALRELLLQVPHERLPDDDRVLEAVLRLGEQRHSDLAVHEDEEEQSQQLGDERQRGHVESVSKHVPTSPSLRVSTACAA